MMKTSGSIPIERRLWNLAGQQNDGINITSGQMMSMAYALGPGIHYGAPAAPTRTTPAVNAGPVLLNKGSRKVEDKDRRAR
jgi:hypothetical protein